MYGMVLMVAITGSGDTASFGKRGAGCTGCTGEVVVSSGCDGAKHHFRGGCGGGGFLGLRNRDKGGCDGGGCTGAGCTGVPAGCTGVPAGCTGVVVAPAAPVVVAAPCAPACDPCAAPACEPAKKKGLFSRLCKKKDKCEEPAPACTTCASAPAVVVPPATVPATMPPVTGKKE